MSFLQRFQDILETYYPHPEVTGFVVAYSGGVDSHVLLHCCSQFDIPVRAVHVHHGLQDEADDWVIHCRSACAELHVPIDILTIDATKQKRQSPEQTARIKRYTAIEKNLRAGECLLTAQHMNDQAETILLQLFRTAGSAGLAGMPYYKQTGEYAHLRPLLPFTRTEIEDYARDNNLTWVEDPSNCNNRFDRNFVRNTLLPMLSRRWPSCIEQLKSVAELQANNLEIQQSMAAIDLANVIEMSATETSNTRWAYDVVSQLSISALQKLSLARRFNLLHFWIKQSVEHQENNNQSLLSQSSPTRKLILEIESALLQAKTDSKPVIVFNGFEFRRFQQQLYLLKKKSYCIEQEKEVSDIQWVPSQIKGLPIHAHSLIAVKTDGEGLKAFLLDKTLTIKFRNGGEQFQPSGRQHPHRLKRLLQEANIPPWERGSLPLICWQDDLIAVPGVGIAAQYSVGVGETGWHIEIR